MTDSTSTDAPLALLDDASSEHHEDLYYLLMKNVKRSADNGEKFWTLRALSQILTKRRILAALNAEFSGKLQPEQINDYADCIRRNSDETEEIAQRISMEHFSSGSDGFLRIFSILVMLDRVGRILDFINYHVTDADLPILNLEVEYSAREQKAAVVPTIFKKWSMRDRDMFSWRQWSFLTPLFAQTSHRGGIMHYELPKETILPWISAQVDKFHYGHVQRVGIDPESHQFQMAEALTSESTFAIKSVNHKEHFDREVMAHEQFAASPNPNVVPLLCTFEREGIYYMIFPWAECNLLEYWRVENPAKPSLYKMRWILHQLCGLVDGLDSIHNSRGRPGKIFGRHGDIKPENILWFKSNKEPEGIFMLSDLGLAELNRQVTQEREARTTTFGFTAIYRPPEIDIADEKLSRSMDIWSLGCVFLEMVCWLLGGFKEVKKLAIAREEGSHGLNNYSFFAMKLNNASQKFEFIVHPQVTQQITHLRRDPNCTQFIQELLDIIEDHMLRINSKERVLSTHLLERLRYMRQRAMEESTSDYMLSPFPEQRQERAVPVLQRTKLDPEVRELIEESRALLTERFSQRVGMRSSMRVREVPSIQLRRTERRFSTQRQLVQPEVIDNDGLLSPKDINDPVPSISMVVQTTIKSSHPDTEIHDVAFDITWQLQQCIRDELDGSTDLGPVLTLTGNSQHAWATSCDEYVLTTWKERDLGKQFLADLKLLLEKDSTTQRELNNIALDGKLAPVGQEDSATSRLTFKGKVAEISILSEFLCWIAASFRLPMPQRLACSYIDFRAISSQDDDVHVFSISLKDLQDLDDGPNTCWKPLFPSTVMAYGFPVPIIHPQARGLAIPFDAMLDMAEILYDVNLEDDNGKDAGIYFSGISYNLYPRAYIEECKTIQWHLESRNGYPDKDRNPAVAPDAGERPKWERISDLNILQSATAILGYCGEVRIQLGTADRAQHHGGLLASRSDIERPPVDISGGAASGTVGFKGFISGTGTVTFKPRNGLKKEKQEAKDLSYNNVLETTRNETVILLDTAAGKQRAWMVSELSLILELFNIWAYKNRVSRIKYATAESDGGAQAMKVLADLDYARRVVVQGALSSESDLQIGDIVKRIYGQIQKCMKENASSDEGARGVKAMGRARIVGWDWLDLTDLTMTTGYRRQLRRGGGRLTRILEPLFKHQPTWMSLTPVVPIFFGQNMGELIIPARTSEVCGQWYPMPGHRNRPYLAASVHCIQRLSERFGSEEPWILFNDLVWQYEDQKIFDRCELCLKNPKTCCKKPQVLGQRSVWSRLSVRWSRLFVPNDGDPLKIIANGAVVFS